MVLTYKAQKIQIVSINNPQGYLMVKVHNTTDKKIVIYENSLYVRFELWNNERIIGYDNFAREYDEYNYNNDFSKVLMDRTQKKYNIDYKQTFYFLQNTKSKIVIPPACTKVLKLKTFSAPTKPLRPLEKTDYYLKGTVFFNDVFYPKQFLDSLAKKNTIILNKIDIPRTKIDIHTFFSNELATPPKLPKGLKYDEKTGKIVEDNNAVKID